MIVIVWESSCSQGSQELLWESTHTQTNTHHHHHHEWAARRRQVTGETQIGIHCLWAALCPQARITVGIKFSLGPWCCEPLRSFSYWCKMHVTCNETFWSDQLSGIYYIHSVVIPCLPEFFRIDDPLCAGCIQRKAGLICIYHSCHHSVPLPTPTLFCLPHLSIAPFLSIPLLFGAMGVSVPDWHTFMNGEGGCWPTRKILGPNGGTGKVQVGSGEATLAMAESRYSTVAAAHCCFAFWWPQGNRHRERDYYQLLPQRVSVPFVTVSSIFGSLDIMNKFALYQSIYYKITLAGMPPHKDLLLSKSHILSFF